MWSVLAGGLMCGNASFGQVSCFHRFPAPVSAETAKHSPRPRSGAQHSTHPLRSACLWVGLLLVSISLAWPVGGFAREAPGPVTIGLQVVETGQPVPGATVQVGARFAVTGPAGAVTFDGLPSGSHALAVATPGFERVEQPIRIVDGARPKITLNLVPVTTLPLSGSVTLNDHGAPLPGTRLTLAPVDVRAAIQGSYQFTSDMNGEFAVPEVPPGVYRLTAEAVGCEPAELSLHVEEGMEPVVLQLRAETQAAALSVRVRDATHGGAIADAWITLAEAWPRGVIARGTTGQDGALLLEGLATGLRNWEAPDALAEFEGIWFTDRGNLELRMHGNALSGRFMHGSGMLEGEVSADGRYASGRWWRPIADLENGQESGRFRFNLADDRASFDGAWGRDEEADPRIRWRGTRAAVSNVTVASETAMLVVLAPGYAPTLAPVQLGPATSLSVSLEPVRLDAADGDHTEMASARELKPDMPTALVLDRPGRQRWFRFRLEQPALVRAIVGPDNPIPVSLALLDAQGAVLGDTWAYAAQEPTIERWLPSGQYLVRAGARGNVMTEQPLWLQIFNVPVFDAHEPNNSIEQARLLVPGRELRGYLAAEGDEDWFRIDVRRPGQLRLQLAPSDLARSLALHDAEGNALRSTWVYRQQLLTLDEFLAPGTYFVQVTAHGQAASLDPYTLRAHWIGDDEVTDTVQTQGRIDTPRTLMPGTLAGSEIFPAGDRDYYRIPVPGRGRVHVRSIAVIAHEIELLSSRQEPWSSTWAYGGQPATLARDAEGAETWFLRVGARGNGASTQPNVVSVWFEPEDELGAMAGHSSPERAAPLDLLAPVRGSLFPVGDQDWYGIEVDHPGLLRLTNTASVAHELQVHDPDGRRLASTWSYAGKAAKLEVAVLPGTHLVHVSARGSGAHSGQYELAGELVRAEPMESVPLAQDAERTLHLNEAQAWKPDQPGDVDRFLFNVTQPGEFVVAVKAPVPVNVQLSDAQTGASVFSTWGYANSRIVQRVSADGPTRYRLELSGRGNVWTLSPGYVLVSEHEREPPLGQMVAAVDPLDPLQVTFRFEPSDGYAAPVEIGIDANGNGHIDLRLSPGDQADWRYPAEGLFRAEARFHGDAGLPTRLPFWVQAQGPRERTGVVVLVDMPSEGQVLNDRSPVSVRAISYGGAPIARVEAALDDWPLPAAHTAPYRFDLPWWELTGTEHLLRVTAMDASGEQATTERRFRVSPYFGLQPADGAVVTGNQVRVSWEGNAFVAGAVRYRPRGSDAWHEVQGDRSRRHGLLLPDLEPGVTYEFQPLAGDEPGPLRTVTRVNGLAFGRTAYGPTIARDYDQRVPVSVRNHADETMNVRLVAGSPRSDELLIGFVEEGAAERPFALAPGEERYFTLSLNAQDANREHYRFPVRIESDSGYSDEAEVRVSVRLPKVELAWEELGPTDTGLGLRYRLTNRGDALTDLTVRSDSAEIFVSPSIEHGLLPAGQAIQLTAYPRLHDGFQSASGQLRATAVGQVSTQAVNLVVPEGQRVYQVLLAPEAGAETMDPADAELLAARTLAAAYLNPDYIRPENWSDGADTTGNGRSDRWTFIDELERILWIGEDTRGDGEIDYVSADVGFDGQFDYAAVRGRSGWQRTSILDIWAETGFTHPSTRSSYDPYDVDVVVNGVVVGELRDSLPEGNHRFRIPVTALSFDSAGIPAGNVLEVRSRRMGGGHYGMSSDFQVKTRLTSTPIWTVAATREEAEAGLRQTAGLLLDEPDYSVASDEISLVLPAEMAAGAVGTLRIPVRNLGVASDGIVPVALSYAIPRGGEGELQRVFLPAIAASATQTAEFEWSLVAGQQRLRVTVDPDAETADVHRANNDAYIWVDVPGDDEAPRLEILSPVDGANLSEPVATLSVRADDDVRIERVEARIDGGLWTPLEWKEENRYDGAVLLQPGTRLLTVRATDGAGNIVERSASVFVRVDPPTIRVQAPPEGATVDTREVLVQASTGTGIALAAARVNGGPWQALELSDDGASGRIALDFGDNRLEIKAVTATGVESIESLTVSSMARREIETASDAMGEADADALARRAARLMGAGDYEGALDAFRASHALRPDPAVEDRVRRLEAYLRVRPGAPRGPARAAPSVTPPAATGLPGTEPRDGPGIQESARPPSTPVVPEAPAPAARAPDGVEIPGFGRRGLNEEGSRLRPPAPDAPLAPTRAPPSGPLPDPDLDDTLMPEPIAAPELDDELLALLDQLEEDLNAGLTDVVDAYDGGPLPGEPEGEPLDLEHMLPELSEALLDYFQNLAEQFGFDQFPPGSLNVDDDNPDIGPLPPHGLGQLPPPGRSVAVRHTQHAHHCTNRPNIRMPFQLPEWLKLIDLPEPGSAEYEAMIGKLLQRLRDQGIDTAAFEQFHQALRRRAGRLDSPDELPGWLESLGLAGPAPKNESELKAWREAMTTRVDAFWLRLLASGDPQLIYQGLSARADAFGKFDEALQISAQAALEEIKAKQQLTEEVLRAIPKVGTALDILLLARGESLSGDKLTWGQAGMIVGFRALMALGPAGAKGLYNRAMNTENGRMFFQALGEMGPNMGASGVRGLARVFGTSEKKVRDIFAWAGDQMTRERSLRGGINGLFGRQAQAAGRNFVPLRAGQSAIYQQRIERRHAERLLDRMAGTTDRHEFRRLAVQLQANKTAQAVINTPRYSDALRLKAERSRAAMGRLADRRTADDILRMAPRENGLERVLRSNPALNRDDVIVRARTITTHRAGQGPVSFGRDRDVWFEFVDRRTGRRLGDIHHDVSKPVYSGHLRTITGRDAESLDHAVTSWWHPDAYATGRYTADSHGRAALVVGSGRRAGDLQRARDVADTARYKPKEWFDPPRDAQGRIRPMGPMEQNQRIREGMRQTIKEYDRHVAPYLRDQGIGPDRLPPRLQQGLDIFRDVQEGVLDDRMTPEQALRMLEALPGNATPQTIADDLAQLVQFLNIWGL